MTDVVTGGSRRYGHEETYSSSGFRWAMGDGHARLRYISFGALPFNSSFLFLYMSYYSSLPPFYNLTFWVCLAPFSVVFLPFPLKQACDSSPRTRDITRNPKILDNSKLFLDGFGSAF